MKHAFTLISVVGTASWSIAGTQVAGEAGMNIIGCGFVGCVSALGGGTLNNLMFGTARNGVHWVQNPRSTVLVALFASVVTFYVWPVVCRTLAERWLKRIDTACESGSWISRVASSALPLISMSGKLPLPRQASRAEEPRSACVQVRGRPSRGANSSPRVGSRSSCTKCEGSWARSCRDLASSLHLTASLPLPSNLPHHSSGQAERSIAAT